MAANRHVTKPNHEKKSTCCPPKIALTRDLVKKTLTLTLTKNYKK